MGPRSGHQLVHLYTLSGDAPVRYLRDKLRTAEDDGVRSVQIDCRNTLKVYPNGAAPAAAIMTYYRERGLDVRVSPASEFIDKVQFNAPVLATKSALAAERKRWNTIWKYETADHVFSLVKHLIEDLIERIEFSPGVLEALSWCLYEILDNVILHAKNSPGFVMLEYHRASKRLVVTVADYGIGIHRSFAEGAGAFRPRTAADALELAVSEWTSSTGERRGNGLYGLAAIVSDNGGVLEIRSGRGVLECTGGSRVAYNVSHDRSLVLDADHHCTVVDFQLDVSRPVNLEGVLQIPHVNLRLEGIEDAYGVHTIPMREYSEKVATREGATSLRVRLLNYLAEGAGSLTLDFTGVGLISSSFADETIGRLVEHFGLVEFRNRFRLVGMTDLVATIVDRAIFARSSRS